jgi:hypothetical protein
MSFTFNYLWGLYQKKKTKKKQKKNMSETSNMSSKMRQSNQILWRSAKCPRSVRNKLGKSEVTELDVSVSRDEDVLGFQVAVRDVARVEVLQRDHDLCCVEPGSFEGQSNLHTQQVEELASDDELKKQVHGLFVLIRSEPATSARMNTPNIRLLVKY